MSNKTLNGVLLDELTELTLSDLCRACSSHAEWIIELVDEGVLEPVGQIQHQWKFDGTSLIRARTAARLQKDLDINLAGVALALDLLEEIKHLRMRLKSYEH